MLIDHIAAGVVLSQSHSKFRNIPALTISICSQILPDLTVLLDGPGTIFYLSHRKYTTTLALSPIYSAILILVTFLLFNKNVKNQILPLYILSLMSWVIHVLYDYFNPYGVKLFWPFSGKIYSLDLIFEFDPVYMFISFLILTVAVVSLIKYKRVVKLKSIYLLATTYLVYAFISFFIKLNTIEEYKNYIIKKYPESVYLETIPRSFWRWKGIAQDSSTFFVIVKENEKIVDKVYDSESEIPLAIKDDDAFHKYLDYARYPVVMKDSVSLRITNLVYSPDTYLLNYKINKSGKVLSSSLSSWNLIDNIY